VIVAACDPNASGLTEAHSGRVLEAWTESLAQAGGDQRDALRLTARRLGMKRAELYRLLAELGEVR
jgi:transcriptional regulator of acetoin/glycerol metabolism